MSQYSGYDGMNGSFASRLRALAAAVEARGGTLGIGSGRRTTEEQAVLYKQKPGLAAPPGKSNHERGTAADLTGDLHLAHQLAPQFGLFFPMDYEPWHIEPAGGGKAFAEGGATDPEAYPAPGAEGGTPVQDKPRTLDVQLAAAAGILGGEMDGSDVDSPDGDLTMPEDPLLESPGAEELNAPGLGTEGGDTSA